MMVALTDWLSPPGPEHRGTSRCTNKGLFY